MKSKNKFLVVLLVILFPVSLYAQYNISLVKLKSGAELKGKIKYINPTDAMVIEIAGVDTNIKMADVESVEEINSPSSNPASSGNTSKENKVMVTDNADYSETFDLKIGEEIIRMRLVRGGEVTMGYDGPGSIFMDTEPIHKANVTSFYMSEGFLTNKLVNSLGIFKKPVKENTTWFSSSKWGEHNSIISQIALKTGLQVRMPTETEWEYAMFSPWQSYFSKGKLYEYCYDYFDIYSNVEYAIDPIGPSIGHRHVIRGMAYDNKCDRSRKSFSCVCRIVIKARDIKNK